VLSALGYFSCLAMAPRGESHQFAHKHH
jgi:hypothetical protein